MASFRTARVPSARVAGAIHELVASSVSNGAPRSSCHFLTSASTAAGKRSSHSRVAGVARHAASSRAGIVNRMASLGDNRVLTLNEPTGVLPRPQVLESDVARDRAEKRDPLADEDGNARDDQTLNEPGAEEPLNRDPTVYVDMVEAAVFEVRQDVGGVSRHALHDGALRSGGERARAEHEHGLLAVRPRFETQDRLEGLAPDDERIHRGEELLVTMGFAAARR